MIGVKGSGGITRGGGGGAAGFGNSTALMSSTAKFLKLDVRAILARGEEPFPVIRERVDGLGEGEGLMLVAPFLPSPLIERLGSEGFRSRVERGKGSEWVVYFWREAA